MEAKVGAPVLDVPQDSWMISGNQWYLISVCNIFLRWFFLFQRWECCDRSLEGNIFFPCEPESIVMFVLRGNPSNMTWNSRQPMTVRWAIQLRSLFHEQQQYVGVSHPGGTCKIWCYETRNADDWKPQQKTDWKKTTRVVFHCHYPLLKTSTFVENWWLEDEISLEMVTFQVTCWFFWGWYNQLLRCVSHEPRKTPGSRCPPNSQGEKVGEVPEEEGSWPRDSIFVARV